VESLQRQASSLQYVAVHPDGYDAEKSYPLVVLLHGFGANMHDLASLAPAIDSTGYVYLFPNAPLTISFGPGMTGSAWTPIANDKTAADVANAEALVTGFVDEMVSLYRPGPGRVLLGGFSQGGMMTYQVGLPRPDTFAGLVALSGRIDAADALAGRLPQEREQPVFIAHGTGDPLIAVHHARESRDFLVGHGYQPIYHEFPIAHEISQAVLDQLAPWVQRVLPPAS